MFNNIDKKYNYNNPPQEEELINKILIPEVFMEVFSYLSTPDNFAASSVCQSWKELIVLIECEKEKQRVRCVFNFIFKEIKKNFVYFPELKSLAEINKFHNEKKMEFIDLLQDFTDENLNNLEKTAGSLPISFRNIFDLAKVKKEIIDAKAEPDRSVSNTDFKTICKKLMSREDLDDAAIKMAIELVDLMTETYYKSKYLFFTLNKLKEKNLIGKALEVIPLIPFSLTDRKVIVKCCEELTKDNVPDMFEFVFKLYRRSDDEHKYMISESKNITFRRICKILVNKENGKKFLESEKKFIKRQVKKISQSVDLEFFKSICGLLISKNNEPKALEVARQLSKKSENPEKIINYCLDREISWKHLPAEALVNIFTKLDLIQTWVAISKTNMQSYCLANTSKVIASLLENNLLRLIKKDKTKFPKVMQLIEKAGPSLNYPKFSFSILTHNQLEKIAESCSKIKKIDLSHCQNLTGKLTILSQFQYLQFLKLSFCNLKDDDIQYLPRDLLSLDLTYCKSLTDEATIYLPPKLKSLNLRISPWLTNKAISLLPRDLLNLNLSGCKNLTDKALFDLPPNLKVIKLYSCKNLTRKGLQQLHQKFPNLKILS